MKKSILDSFCKNPSYDLVTTVLGVGTGLFGSLFSNEIKNAVPFNWENLTDFSPAEFSEAALLFWCLLLLFSILFYFRHFMTHKTQNRLIEQTEKIENQGNFLENLIRTLPPEDFLYSFSEIYNLCHKAAWKPFKYKNSDLQEHINDIEHAIRTILDGVVALTAIFDGKPKSVIYAANIMIYKSISDLPPSEVDNISDKILFVEKGFDVTHLAGVLRLRENLSTTTETEKPIPDAELRELYLPIPSPTLSESGLCRYLPGAPAAFIKDEMSIYIDTHTLGSWCRKKGDFSPSLCDNLEAYFRSEKGKKIRSFVSLPLSNPRKDSPIGVLNIHRDKVGIMAEKKPSLHFLPLMQPYLSLIIDLTVILGECYDELAGKKDYKSKG